MNTAPEGIQNATPGTTPGPLAILTATALGGLLGSRMTKTPLVLAAGAAALALIRQKHGKPPPPAAASRSQVDQWLDQQISRDAVVDDPFSIPTVPTAPAGDADDCYIPEPFLPDDECSAVVRKEPAPDYAKLAEPVVRISPEDGHSASADAPPHSPVEAEFPLQGPQLAPEQPEPPADQSWLLGVAPIPSLHEPAASPISGEAFFASDPAGREDLPAPAFIASVFQGGALPDEIDVPEAPPAPEHLFPTFSEDTPLITGHDIADEAVPQHVPAIIEAKQDTPEIEVQIAGPGDASFDPPPMLSTDSPWDFTEQPPDLWPTSDEEAPPPSGPVIEAEIVLRPRAPVQNRVTSRLAATEPAVAEDLTVISAPHPDHSGTVDASVLPRAPVQTPREQRARQTWRSWWRGD